MNEQIGRRVWIDGDKIITRNADGGTTAWNYEEAVMLSRDIDPLLHRLASKEGEDE